MIVFCASIVLFAAYKALYFYFSSFWQRNSFSSGDSLYSFDYFFAISVVVFGFYVLLSCFDDVLSRLDTLGLVLYESSLTFYKLS